MPSAVIPRTLELGLNKPVPLSPTVKAGADTEPVGNCKTPVNVPPVFGSRPKLAVSKSPTSKKSAAVPDVGFGLAWSPPLDFLINNLLVSESAKNSQGSIVPARLLCPKLWVATVFKVFSMSSLTTWPEALSIF